jgi:hypothetical protein
MGVGGRRVAADVAEDARAALAGRLLLLQHENAGALAHYEAVAPAVERARDPGVAERVHLPEGRGGQRGDGRLAAAGHDRVGVAVADQPLGHADRVRAGRAGRDRPEGLAAQVVLHRNHARGRIGHQQRDGQRRDALGALLLQHDVLRLERADAADAGPDDRGRALWVVRRPAVPAGVVDRLLGGRERELGEAVRATHLLVGEVLLGLELGRATVAVLDPGHARRPPLVKRASAHAERRDGAYASDDNRPRHPSFDITRSTA